VQNLGQLNSGPLGRPGQPVEIAAPVIFLASWDASYITGVTLHINSGMVRLSLSLLTRWSAGIDQEPPFRPQYVA